jgi:hypothetical protein
MCEGEGCLMSRLVLAPVNDQVRLATGARHETVIRPTTTQPVRSIKGQRPRTAAPIS